MVRKWIKGLLTHPFTIIKGNLFRLFKRNNLLYKHRYIICIQCPNLEKTKIGEVCGLCGCPLKSKLRVKDEKCEINRW
jgi:hypothetical protein